MLSETKITKASLRPHFIQPFGRLGMHCDGHLIALPRALSALRESKASLNPFSLAI